MEKVTRFLPLALFCVFSVKLIAQDYVDISEASVLLIMAFLSAFYSSKQSEEFKVLENRINLLQSAAEKDAQEIAATKKELEDTKGLLGGIKLGQQLKSQMTRL